MAKFRKKPIVIEAEQYSRKRFVEECYLPVGAECHRGIIPFVTTAHKQKVFLEDGDWVAPELNGDGYYPIKPDVMEATYDPVEG